MSRAFPSSCPYTIARALGMLLPTFVLLPLVGLTVGVDYDVIADNTSKFQLPGDTMSLFTSVLMLATVFLILAALGWLLGRIRQPVSIPSS